MENLIDIKGVPTKLKFDKDNFKIYSFVPDSSCEESVIVNKYGNISIQGTLPHLVLNKEYSFKVRYKKNGQYDNYIVERFGDEKIELNPSETKDFLCQVIDSKKAETILSVYPNIIELILANKVDTIDVKKLHGFGQKSLEKVVSRILSTFAYSKAIAYFKGCGFDLTMNQVEKIYSKYKSFELIKENMDKNPYDCLCDVQGISFKTADSKIVEFNPKLRDSKFRMIECIKFVLSENEMSGNTYLSISELKDKCESFIYEECMCHFNDCICDKKFKKINNNSCLIKIDTYNTERELAFKIAELVNINIKYDVDESKYTMIDGKVATEEQRKVLTLVKENSFVVLTGFGGCVDMDTEYFNGTSWVKISDYKQGDKVLQFNLDRTAELVYPSRYVKIPEETMYHFRTKYGLDQCLSSDHDVVYVTSKGNINKQNFMQVKERHERTSSGFNGKFITTFDYKDNDNGIDLTDEQIRVMVAVIADGHFNNAGSCVFRIKKERKILRLKDILNKAKISYFENVGKDHYHQITIKAPRTEKHFTSYWYGCNKHQREVIADEVLHWDGNYSGKRRRFSTAIKETADFVQFVFSSLGERCVVNKYDRRNEERKNSKYERKSIDYEVNISSKSNIISMGFFHSDEEKTKINEYKTKDGYKYCFTVDSGMLVLRRNGRIFITGNCGKSFSVSLLNEMLKDLNKSVLYLSTTGKASKVLSDYTGEEVLTIHRGLKYNPKQGWVHNAENPLEHDIVIVDESSMIDIDLGNALLDAINPATTKLLLIGDSGQLPSVSKGNFLMDLITSERVPVCRLNTVFRYGEGGLARVCTETRNGNKFLSGDKLQVFGTNKDFVFFNVPKEESLQHLIHVYKTLLNRGAKMEEIMVLSAYNTKEFGTININKLIQNEFNKTTETFGYKKNQEEILFKKGDMVINTKNSYNIEKVDSVDEEDVVSIFNGEMGVVFEIKEKSMIVEYDGNVLIEYDSNNVDKLLLGYCISIHKSQGSQAKYVICTLPSSHTYMLDRNLLYTAFSRSKDKVYCISEPKTVNNALRKSSNLSRRSLLCDLLKYSI